MNLLLRRNDGTAMKRRDLRLKDKTIRRMASAGGRLNQQ
jgi:hypothetical protein